MLVLIDTGILLRLFDRLDPRFGEIHAALRFLWGRGDEPVITAQNAAEFWNVSTRPSVARGGYGQTISKTSARLSAIERICRVLPDTPAAFTEWKRLVVAHSVIGVAVHDARLVAQMVVWQVGTIMTLNTADFSRYPGIAARSPADLISATSGP